ncbi:hypothetical protein M408DRAFT_277543 [Serendipita vermifera MAFF 305830]|uniref:VLIG-type G domain-containing protein n=1 Tax=Serendipita vermifera MAFF 305830 TaxID=933852 RepID=A0A0C3AS91_SERVB|nr:hypothetical protein M408DRAFT_277543 [Serendipita vermifera MAFF 305830]
MTFWIATQASRLYTLLEHGIFESTSHMDVNIDAGDRDASIAKADTWLNQYPDLRQRVSDDVQSNLRILDADPNTRFNVLKRRLSQIYSLIHSEQSTFSEADIRNLADLVVLQKDKAFKSGMNRIINSTKKSSSGGLGKMFTALFPLWTNQPANPKISVQSPPSRDDPAFVEFLKKLEADEPHFQSAIIELKLLVTEMLSCKIKSLSAFVQATLIEAQKTALEEDVRTFLKERRQKEEVEAWNDLRNQVEQCLINSIPEENDGTTITINSIVREGVRIYDQPETFLVTGTRSSPYEAGFEYTIFPIEIKQDDFIAISNNFGHICKPLVRSQHARPLSVPVNFHLRFIHLLEKDLVLVIIEEPSAFMVYAEAIEFLSSAITQRRAVKKFHLGRLGLNPLFAFNYTKGLLAIFSVIESSVQLNVYSFDSTTKLVHARGNREDITKWYNQVPEMVHLLFVGGTEELLLVEKSGLCRIFSLVTANFRPSTLKLTGDPEAAFSTADGACLIMKILINGEPHIFCYHWTSFGSNEGTRIPWPTDVSPDSQMIVSSFSARQNVHIIFMDRGKGLCKSIRLRITSNSREFAFRSNPNTGGSPDFVNTVNNSLIDCHAEVWTAYPVNAAISKESVAAATHHRRSILFVSSTEPGAFAPYFENMVREFKRKSRKPTKNLLTQIVIQTAGDWKVASRKIPTSKFQMGDWLVGLFCLIPIHLAVTRSNRFIPLKDGIDSPEFEHSLLGASVAQICEALSFGWYESIFNSYLASKPVKVVTSMGEQSVGKSFALNHFVDTSFAGSAMRCTEGVWLSVTPTRDYLVVAMDFEGVHSVERSAQEDTLLVLLNSAISNLVLFRNNFALSRDITGLFNSFQNCTKVLDPASNPSLFRSALAIIIKDVSDSGTKEIVNEFQQKFDRIVQKEKEDNFISKLYGGTMDIIPWPVIGTSGFYNLFNKLRTKLNEQKITHPHAGAFLGVLKMLMAKLKANDWGALDQNLSAQRAQLLTTLLPTALAFGTIDPANDEPLKV